MKSNNLKAINSKITEIYNKSILDMNIYLLEMKRYDGLYYLRHIFHKRCREESNPDYPLENINIGLSHNYRIYFHIFDNPIDDLTEDDILELDDDSLIEVIYNHTNPDIRSLILNLLDKPYIWLDFLLNDPDGSVRREAFICLFGEEYLEDIINIDYYGKIPIKIIFKLKGDIQDDFGIYESLFKRFDKLIISEISIENDELIVKTDPKNSYEHAVSQLTNQDALKVIASYHENWSVRMLAINKILDEDYLLDMALNGFKDGTPDYVPLVPLFGKYITWIDVLKSVFDRLLSLKNLSGTNLDEFLLELFRKSKEHIIRKLCISKIENEEVLIKIAFKEVNPSFVRVIWDKINDDYLILLLIYVLKNPLFDIRHLNKRLSDFEERSYMDIIYDACKMLVSMDNEVLNKSLKDLNLKPDLKRFCDETCFKDIQNKTFKEILLDIVNNDENSSVRAVAVRGINDKNDLINIALNDKDAYVSYNALLQLNDESFIKDYVIKYKKDPYYLVNENLIKDQSLLADIAKNDSSGVTRKAAVKNLEDETLLEYIAKNDSESDVRLEAVSKIKNQSVLIDIAYNDSKDAVKDLAISKINNENILEDLLNKTEDSGIIETILSKINNQKIITDYIHHPSFSVRCTALKNIKDNQFLVNIAKTDEDEMIRRNIIEILVERSINKNIIKILVERFINKNNEIIDDNSIILYENEKETYTLQSLLVDRAYNDDSPKVREFAVLFIHDDDLLFDIVNNDPNIEVQLAAIENMTNNELLTRIVVKSKNHHVYRKAIFKIKYKYLLLKLMYLKHYYGELWHKSEIAKYRFEELGFTRVDTSKYDKPWI